MAELPNVSPGEIIASDHINDIRDRSIQRYTSVVERDTLNPTPTPGDLAYLADTDELQVFDGAAWIMGGGGTLTGILNGTAAVFSQAVTADTVQVTGTFLHHTPASGTFAIRKNVTNMIQLDDEVTVRINNGRLLLNGLSVRENAGFFQVPQVWANTTASAANVVVTGTTGGMVRSTSARKYKQDIQPADHLADLTLEPVTFTHMGDGSDRIGFIADDMPDPRMIESEDGEVENYDLRAVVAILAAKVARLEA